MMGPNSLERKKEKISMDLVLLLFLTVKFMKESLVRIKEMVMGKGLFKMIN